MIDNIVELPRPLGRSRGCFSLSSYSAYEPPSSPLGMVLGIDTEIKDMPICVGSEFSLITGSDAMYRYKVLEHDAEVKREFFVVSDSPLSSKNCKLFTLWVDEISEDLRRRRSYFWNLIEEARKYFSFRFCPCLSKDVQDAVKVYGALIGAPWLASRYKWPHVISSRSTSDAIAFDDLYKIRGNLDAIYEAMVGDAFIHELDVFRGVSEPDDTIKIETGLGRFLSSNPVSAKDLRKFIGPNYATRINQTIPVPDKVTDNSIKDAANDCNGWIDVFKHISDIPYSEVFAELDSKGYKVIRVLDPYDRPRSVELELNKDDVDIDVRSSFERVFDSLESICQHKECRFYRSWSEEVYITFKTKIGASITYYFDLAYMALSLPMFTDQEVVL